ncbi:MAG: histidine triad nucleotide-binding protein [Eubacteriales bacterium]|jgi:histidine triad (HIT) family protein|nr:histidine triad nucleotide-binding protein [Clostridiales bacterium]
MDCIFCKIIAGEIPSSKVYEDEHVLAFKDINPQAPVHVLVIPKTHIESVDKLDATNADIAAKVLAAVPAVARQSGLTEGYRVITNVGKHGCQSVFHLHFHVLGGKQLPAEMS